MKTLKICQIITSLGNVRLKSIMMELLLSQFLPHLTLTNCPDILQTASKPNYELIVSADGYKSETYRFVNINREVLFIAGKMVAVYRNIYKKENRKFPETSEDFSVPKINTESALIFKCILKRE